ncbi:hypothetical protein TSST111916_12365 [Tsukamurella strandjordii]|uniref:hypothetical protein n=1 Tax=Tsukamurella TaxID=2060 RepID=UPI001C7D6F0A|nr:hypothetical protein [Tsukamurella sp. TY48]GIZ97786.1 hypothetical protein TTY48_23980 [Tsukamurella sp. TY48]
MTDRPTTLSQVSARRRPGRAARGVAAVLAAGAVLMSAGCGNEPAQQTTSVTLPASFPKDEVPLVDGTLIDAGERSQDGVTVYNVTVQAQPGGYDAAKKKLTDAGYLALGDGPEGASRSAQFSGKGYVVTVSSVDGGAVPNAVYYSVSKG